MTRYIKTMSEALKEVYTYIGEGKEKSGRQFINSDKEVMVVKKNKVIVIDKKDQDKYLKQGWELAEEIELEEELSPEQIAAEEKKAMDQFNSDMAKEFPAAKFTARATTSPMGGGIAFLFAVIPTKEAKGAALMNAPAHSKYMMHLTDNSGKRVPMSKFSIQALMGRLPVKFRKIAGKSPTDAVKKMVDWFKKNKSEFEGLIKEEVDLDEGYEKTVLLALKDEGIGGYFSKDILYVAQRKIEDAKAAIKAAGHIKVMPKIMGEEVDLDEALKKGAKVEVPHKGKRTQGTVVRYVPQRGAASPYYVVYVGEYGSIEVPAHKIKEEVELDEANYEIKNGKVHISKKEFAKVSKDYKGKDTMTVLDPKTQKTVNMPVVFEEVELDEAPKNYYEIGGDRYDGGVVFNVYVNGKKVHDQILDGNAKYEYKGKKYDDVGKAMDAIAKAHNLKAKDFKRMEMEELELEDQAAEKKYGRKKAGSYGRPGSKKQKRAASKAVRKLGKKLDEEVSVKDFDSLKKGDTVTIEYKAAMSSGTSTFNVTAKNTVAKGKVEKVTLKSAKNPGGVKSFLYKRNDKVSFAQGDMGAAVVSFKKEELELDERITRDQTYFKTYSDAVSHALEYTKSRGYEVDEDDFHNKVTTGPRKPSEGKTVSQRIAVTKDGKPVKKQLSFQVYNKGGKNPYELNVYVEEVEKPFKKLLDEMSARGDAMKGMRNDPLLGKRDEKEYDDAATASDIKAASKNIMYQLQQVLSLRGGGELKLTPSKRKEKGQYGKSKGDAYVEFSSGKKEKVDRKVARAIMIKYNSIRRPMDKQIFQIKIAKSYKDMLRALKESLKESVMKEGTWGLPDTPKLKAGFKKVMNKPIKAKDATKIIGPYIGDDELFDDLDDLVKDDPNQDVRPTIKSHMKRLGIKEDTILDRITNKIQERKNG